MSAIATLLNTKADLEWNLGVEQAARPRTVRDAIRRQRLMRWLKGAIESVERQLAYAPAEPAKHVLDDLEFVTEFTIRGPCECCRAVVCTPECTCLDCVPYALCADCGRPGPGCVCWMALTHA